MEPSALFLSTSEALRNQHVLYKELSAILFLKNARSSFIKQRPFRSCLAAQNRCLKGLGPQRKE